MSLIHATGKWFKWLRLKAMFGIRTTIIILATSIKIAKWQPAQHRDPFCMHLEIAITIDQIAKSLLEAAPQG